MPVTLEQFRASRVWSDNTDATLGFNNPDVVTPGYVYLETYYINRSVAHPDGWSVDIEDRSYGGTLEYCEELLYDYLHEDGHLE